MTPTTRRLILALSTLAGASVATACSAVLGLGDPVLDDSLGKDQVVDVAHFDSAFVDAPADTTADGFVADDGGDGATTAEKIVTGDTTFTPWGVAVNDVYVFWTNYHIPGSIGRADKDGKNKQILASGNNAAGLAPAFIKADNTDVYWSALATNGPEIHKCAVTGCGGTPTSLVTPPLTYTAYHLALSATYVYFSAYSQLKVVRVLKSGGPPEDVVLLPAKPNGLNINGNTLYVALEDGSVAKADLGGALPATPLIITPSNSPKPAASVTSTSSRVYYTNFADPGSVYWSSTSGADAGSGVQAAQFSYPIDIDNDGLSLYWAVQGTGGTDGEIDTCTLAGNCVPKPLAQGYSVVKQLALDSNYVYFSVKEFNPPGAIVRVHK